MHEASDFTIKVSFPLSILSALYSARSIIMAGIVANINSATFLYSPSSERKLVLN
ncbi:hypothetical protein D3C86_2135030 [compost metagenome]